MRAINDGSYLDLVMKNCFDAFAVLTSKVERNQAESPEMAMKINQEIAKICQRYVEFGLQSARESAYDEDDGHEEDGAAGIEALDVALDVVAELFRATVSLSVRMLVTTLHEKINFLLQLAALSTDNAARHADLQRAPELFEELWWLLRLVGHVVADDGRGETPMRPLQFDENNQTKIALRQIGELFIGSLKASKYAKIKASSSFYRHELSNKSCGARRGGRIRTCSPKIPVDACATCYSRITICLLLGLFNLQIRSKAKEVHTPQKFWSV